MIDSMPVAVMAKNYSHCPLKKRPVVQIYYESSDEPENLSTKPEDLRQAERRDVTSPSSADSAPSSPHSSSPTSPSPPVSPLSPSAPRVPTIYQPKPIKSEPYPIMSPRNHEKLPYLGTFNPEYAPQTWHRSVAPVYPSYPMVPYVYHPEYMGPISPHSDNSLSPPHHLHQQPLAPLALRPFSVEQSSLSPNSSSTTSPPPSSSPEDLSEKRRQGVRHQCPDCGKSYSTFSGLSKHRQFHCAAGDGPKKSFSCKYCSKVYYSLGALKMHIRTHTLPCKCTICGKAFSRPWLLQGHIRTHTGEKPFSCTYCNRAFADRSNLRAHLQTHSDVKKYSCLSCSKTFSRMSLLTKHAEGGCGSQTIMHSEKMYQ